MDGNSYLLLVFFQLPGKISSYFPRRLTVAVTAGGNLFSLKSGEGNYEEYGT